MAWEETEEYIRSGHGDPEKYDKDSYRTIDIDSSKGIKAIVACPVGHFKGGRCDAGMEVTSYLFAKDKGWSMVESKKWFREHEDKHKTR